MKNLGCGTIIVLFCIFALIVSFFKADIKDEKAVIKDMQGEWIGWKNEGGRFTHFRIIINDNNFKGWMALALTDDEPSWNTYPDEEGEFILSPVQTYTNASGKYRNINFYKKNGGNSDNSLSARSFTNNIIYDDGSGLYVVGWSKMESK